MTLVHVVQCISVRKLVSTGLQREKQESAKYSEDIGVGYIVYNLQCTLLARSLLAYIVYTGTLYNH